VEGAFFFLTEGLPSVLGGGIWRQRGETMSSDPDSSILE
jgi:hypothetical protein